MSRIVEITAAACLAAFSLAMPVCAQEARFQLALAWTEPEIGDVPSRFRRTIDVTLGQQGKVTEQVRRGSPGRGRQGHAQSGVLGEDIDGRHKGHWKVVNERTLVRLTAERSHTVAIWLTHDGAGSCSVRLEWRLKPGFTAYERWGVRREGTVRFGQPVVEHASCRSY